MYPRLASEYRSLYGWTLTIVQARRSVSDTATIAKPRFTCHKRGLGYLKAELPHGSCLTRGWKQGANAGSRSKRLLPQRR